MSFGFGFGLTQAVFAAGGPSLLLQFAGATTLDPRITFTRASSATYFNSAGVLTTVGNNVPRFDYNPSTLAARGLLIEDQRTNYLYRSADFSATWSTSPLASITITQPSGPLTPDGTQAWKYATNDTASSAHTLFQAWVGGIINTGYCFSVFLKAAEYPRASVWLGNTAFASLVYGGLFDLTSGTIVTTAGGSTARIEDVGGGWYRCSVTGTSDADGGNYVAAINFAPATVSTVSGTYTPASTGLGGWVWGAQVEIGDFPSSYIPTPTTASVTREKDVALISSVDSWYNAVESTLYAEAQLPVAQDTANRVLFSLSTTSINDSAYLFRGSNQNRVFMSVSAGGVSGQFSSAGFVISDNTAFKAAGAIKVNDGALTLNGATPQTDNILTMPASATVAAIGVGSWNTASPQAFAWFRQIAYYPRRVANAQLQTITAPTVTASLVASRLSGTAPLAIHLDATGTTSTAVSDPFRQVIYSFDYGDSGSGTWSTDGRSKNTDSGGPLGAHVFETAGTYTVTLTANDGGSISTTSVNITVNDPDTVYSGTNTICITNGSTGANDWGPAGCAYQATLPSGGAAWTNKRVLFKRGVDYTALGRFSVPRTSSGVRIGAAGAGAKPLLRGINLNEGNRPTTAQWIEDIVVSDIDFRSVGSGSPALQHSQCGRNICVLRCDFADPTATVTSTENRIVIGGALDFWAQVQFNGTTYGNGDSGRVLPRSAFYVPKYVFVVECYQRSVVTPTVSYNALEGSVDSTVCMGNDFRGAGEHMHRFYFSRKLLVQHSKLEDISKDGTRHAIKFMSGGFRTPQSNVEDLPNGLTWYAEQIVVRNNILGASDSTNDWTVIVAPQNTGSVTPEEGQEGIQDTILENNSFINSPGNKVQDIIVGPARRTTTRGNTRNDGAIRIDQNNNTYVEPTQSQWRGPYYGQFTG